MRSILAGMVWLVVGALAQDDDLRRELAPQLQQFAGRLQVAEWLTAYELAAWHSTAALAREPEALRATLGTAWFCQPGEAGWEAFYGRLDDAGTYTLLAHYRLNEAGIAEPQPLRVVTAEETALARAVATALVETEPPTMAMTDGTTRAVRLNPFVRRVDEAIEVWLMPAWQPDGLLVFGWSACLRFRLDGHTPIDRQTWAYGLGGTPPNPAMSLAIGDRKAACPSVGDLFFALNYGRLFARLTVVAEAFESRQVERGGGRVWSHLRRPAQ